MTDQAVDRASQRRTQLRVFALTWLSYASYYLVRKNFSVAKKEVREHHGVTESQLFHIDTGYLAAYAIGQFLWGFTSDKVGARRVIGYGMIATAACSVAFGLSSTFAMFALAFGLNGLAQATGWSPNVKAMSAAYSREGRGRVMGFWTTSYVIGGLVANPVALAFIVALGWRAAFHFPAAWVAGVGVLVLLLLPEARADAQGERRREDAAGAFAPAPETDAERRAARAAVLRTPLVWVLGASYFTMKLTRYVLLFWLVYYMENDLRYSKALATNIALVFEIGGTAGAIAIGWISDRWFSARRVPVSIISLVVLSGALVLYGRAAPTGVVENVAVLAAVGFFLFGPDALLSGAAAQDLGGPAAAATAAGIINGMGSVGPIFGSEIANAMTARYGWSAFYAMLGAGSLLSALILLPYWRAGQPRHGGEPRAPAAA